VSDKQLSTTREALMAELLIDVDRLLNKVSELDQTLGETIEKSTREAANKGYLTASLQIKRLTEDLEFKIESASQKAHSFQAYDRTKRPTDKERFHSETGLIKLFAMCLTGGLLGTVLGQTILQAL
jgi:hypothetical protein